MLRFLHLKRLFLSEYIEMRNHMNYKKPRIVAFMMLGMFFIAQAIGVPALSQAGGGPAGHGHGKAKKDHEKEKKKGPHGGMPMSGGQMKMGDHMETGGHGGGGHGGPAIKDFSKIQARGFKLISDLHCNACHFITSEMAHGAGHGGGHGGVAPDLSFLGDKFRPDWLFEFLRKPHVIRPWLNIRMPNFRFNESEAVSLVKHLSKDMRDPSLPPIRNGPIPLNEQTVNIEAGKKLMSKEYFDCWSCHMQGGRKPAGPPETWAPDLMVSARRLKPDWIVRWIRDPQKLTKGTKMPTFFEDNESGPDDILGGDEAKQIRAIAAYIANLGGKGETGNLGRRELVSLKRKDAPAGAAAERPSAFELAVKRYPKASRARGARLMNEMNCAGCHDAGGMHEKLEAGPPLAHEGSRVKKKWLIAFLKKPFRIRPIGYAAGANSRMPDFRLSGEEAGAIAGFLMTRVDGRIHSDTKPHGVSKAAAKRGARLFASLRCGACHSIKADRDMKGNNRFRGPDLTKAGRRLQVEHLAYYLAGEVGKTGSKIEMDAHPLIPGMGLSKKKIDDLAAYISTMK